MKKKERHRGIVLLRLEARRDKPTANYTCPSAGCNLGMIQSAGRRCTSGAQHETLQFALPVIIVMNPQEVGCKISRSLPAVKRNSPFT